MSNLTGSSSYASPSSVYRLDGYKWRTFLSILGPSLVLGFYSFVCFYFLANPPFNDIIPSTEVDGRWVFYLWLIISVFIFDWARTGVANVEAAALMNPRLAPDSAMELMWHADSNWANVLWWLRAFRNTAQWLIYKLRTGRSNHVSRPGPLWWVLSAITFLLFIVVPLSGLTMELSNVYSYGTEKALIFGPQSDTFNFKTSMDLPRQIRGNWRSGRPTTPSNAAILYAVEGTVNVSNIYYQDKVLQNENDSIRIFAGPAVNDMVVGSAWGLSANISCRPTRTRELKLIAIRGYDDYVISRNESLLWINETGVYYGKSAYSLVAAADGTMYGDPPYCNISNHDHNTLDSIIGNRSEEDVTTAIFEAYLWQGYTSNFEDTVMSQLLGNASEFITITDIVGNPQVNSNIIAAGFGVHCDVTSAVGTAEVDPAYRTYSSFRRGFSKPSGTDVEAYPVQVQALRAIGDYNQRTYTLKSRNPEQWDSTWLAAHLAIGLLPYAITHDEDNEVAAHREDLMNFPALTPANLTIAIYKLLGESMIALMDQGGHNATYGDLYSLTRIKYLKPGIVPWRYVLTLLSLWTILVVSASVWMAFTRRWAPSLSAFEFFKFGTQYTDDVNSFPSTRFEECGRLTRIPGMVGMLSEQGGDGVFIGLSDNVAKRDGRYVFDRAKVAVNQPSEMDRIINEGMF